MRSIRSEALGYANFAKSYLQTAKFVNSQIENGDFKLTYDAPLYLLLAHSFELYLKSALISQEIDNTSVESFGHDLLKLFDANKKQKLGADWIATISKSCRTRWKEKLRSARDEHKTRLDLAFGELENPEEFGILDNNVIGSNLPELRRQVIWMSEKHSKGGSQFRYLAVGIDSYHVINAFGLKENVALRSIEWACEDLGKAIRQHYFPKRKRPLT